MKTPQSSTIPTPATNSQHAARKTASLYYSQSKSEDISTDPSDHHAREKSYWKWQVFWQAVGAIATILAFAAAAIYACLAHEQLAAMQASLNQTIRMADSAATQARAMQDTLPQMQAQASAARTAAAAAESQADSSKRQAEASVINAQAAKESARDAAIGTMAQLTLNASEITANNGSAVLTIENLGQSTAHNVRLQGAWTLQDNPPPDFDPFVYFNTTLKMQQREFLEDVLEDDIERLRSDRLKALKGLHRKDNIQGYMPLNQPLDFLDEVTRNMEQTAALARNTTETDVVDDQMRLDNDHRQLDDIAKMDIASIHLSKSDYITDLGAKQIASVTIGIGKLPPDQAEFVFGTYRFDDDLGIAHEHARFCFKYTAVQHQPTSCLVFRPFSSHRPISPPRASGAP
jgi:hypothetical protein